MTERAPSRIDIFSVIKLRLHQIEEGITFIELLAIVAGVVGGLGAVAFRLMISLNQTLFFSYLLPYISFFGGNLNFGIILLPAIGGLIAGPIINSLAPETKGHGVPEVMESYALKAGKIRSRVAFIKVLVSSITIGSGGSAGREGPIAQIGASTGSILGRLFKLKDDEVRLLVVCGLSSGIAGTFNAPLGGALFGMEILQGRFSWKGTVPIILASVVGAAIANVVFGLSPTIISPTFRFLSATELLLYFIVGIAFGFLSYAWVRIFYFVEDLFEKIKLSSKYKVAVGGVLTGAIGMFFPKYGVLGVGYDGVDLALAGSFAITLMLVLGLAKIFATSFTIGSGGSGGIFSPSLYIGSMFGGVLGLLFNAIMPGLASQPFAYSLAGMGALFAGAARAPITSMIMIPEMTADWHLLPPLMISCITSFYISSSLLKKSSIYTLKLERRGVNVKASSVPDYLDYVKVEEVMEKKLVTVSENTTISELMWLATEHGHTMYPVVSDSKLMGTVSYVAGLKISPEKRDELKVRTIMERTGTTAFPGETVGAVLKRMEKNTISKILIVDVSRPQMLLGILTERDVVKAHELGLSRSSEID